MLIQPPALRTGPKQAPSRGFVKALAFLASCRQMFYDSAMTSPFSGYQRILLPIDFTEHCERTARHAAWLAQQSAGTLHLAHIVENPLDPIYKPEEVQHWVVVEHASKRACEMMEETARTCIAADTPRELHILAGDPSEKLVELA